MKILFLSHRIPYPPNKGDKIRSFNEIKYLSKDHEIHLGCLADNPADIKYKRDLQGYCSEVAVFPINPFQAKITSLFSLPKRKPLSVGYFYSKSLQKTVNQWLDKTDYDAVICFSSPMAEYLFRAPSLRQRFNPMHPTNPTNSSNSINSSNSSNPSSPKPRLIMDFCDVDCDKWVQYAGQSTFPLSLLYKLEGKLLFSYEKKINRVFDHSIFVSKQETDLFLKLYPYARSVSTIQNGVDSTYFSPQLNESNKTNKLNKPDKPKKPNEPKQPNKPLLLFPGAMDYHANVDGVVWFCNQIFPMIKKEIPECSFYIVGSNPTPEVVVLGKMPGVIVTGFVEDIRPYYQMADICVIPLRLARGIQNKVLEAMAMEKPVVTTTKAAEGIQASNGEHLIVEDSEEGFSKAVIKMIRDKSEGARLGKLARNFVVKNYDWATNMKMFEALLTN